MQEICYFDKLVALFEKGKHMDKILMKEQKREG